MSTAKRLVLSWRGRKQSHDSSVGRLVGHGGGGALGPGDNHELDEIAVVSSNADPCHVKYGSGTTLSTINGPRLVPGIITTGGCMVGERLSSSGTCLNVSSPVQSTATTGAPHKTSSESVHRVLKSVSRQSLLDLVGCKLGMSKSRQPQSYHQQRYFSSSHDSISTAYINRAANVSSAASELDLSRKARRKDLRGRLKLPTSVTLASSGEAPLLGAWRTAPGSTAGTNPPSTNHLNSTSSCNGTESRYGFRRGDSYSSRLRTGSANWSFVFDPAGRLCYYWSMVVSLAFLYNFWVIIYRFAFREIDANTILVWFCLDYFADFLYLVDIMFHFRTGYLEDGVLQTDSTKLRHHYMNSTTFYIDCLCLLPLDFLYLSVGFNSILRSFRLVKIYRFWAFMDRTERHTNYPNLFRSTSLIHYLLVIFHWNGCLFHIILKNDGFGSKNWVYSDSESTDYVKAYLQSYYWCTLALTTIGDLPRPRNKGEYLFVIFQLLFGLLLFATVLGHVANIVTSVSAARKEFQDNSAISKLDGVKTYMRMRRVPNHLQVKVIKWFDYLWLTQKCSDEERAVSCLPDKLKAEIAINVHLDTLKRVEIFQNTEAGFLCELVLRLRPVLFSPGDYICRKGEVGKEMYIVNRGRLQVVADNGRTVLATLKAGSYFGEISILNMGTAGNRRTASVRSVGYSDLFVLSKKDMWDVLKEYPAARVRLEAIAVKRLEKYKRAPLEKAAMGRSQSTPGLVESRGKVPLEDMWVPPAVVGYTPAYPRSLMGSPPRPVPDSPLGSTSSGRSHHHTPASHARSGTTLHCDSMTQLVSGTASPLLGSHEALESEIKRLRERLHTVETENAAMSEKLNQQQWELENRLAEIEMQICGSRSTSSLEDNERNRESII
ncbi:cyclic nucleotide-gated channel rod photoreceptor subunit alpha isoform X2 [Zophobas morio]|uniref:cyclic nucleotide-gated channel rod photoreceptor subunit alpha isoform X2 n=1 Tax=Zophobas morio TaxID=2755281 RepID=UPI00308330E0